MAESAASVAIRKSVTVGVPVETAFAVFTEQIGSWWPLATKSVGQKESVGLVIEPQIGGRVYEQVRSGGARLGRDPHLGATPPGRLHLASRARL